MIRILHSVSNMDRAGIETMLMNYYRHIDRSKIQFDFLCNKKKPGAYDDEIKRMGGRIYHTPGLNPAKYPSYLKCMKKIFEENSEYKIVELLEQGKMSVKVLKTNDTWYGMTYHEDVAAVKGSFKEMLENGVYKADLFSDL